MSDVFVLRLEDQRLQLSPMELQKDLQGGRLRFRMQVGSREDVLEVFVPEKSVTTVDVLASRGKVSFIVSTGAAPIDYLLAVRLAIRLARVHDGKLNGPGADSLPADEFAQEFDADWVSSRAMHGLHMALENAEAQLSSNPHRAINFSGVNQSMHIGGRMLERLNESPPDELWRLQQRLQWLDRSELVQVNPQDYHGQRMVEIDLEETNLVRLSGGFARLRLGDIEVQVPEDRLLDVLPDSAEMLSEDTLLIPKLNAEERAKAVPLMHGAHHDYLANAADAEDARQKRRIAGIGIWVSDSITGRNCLMLDRTDIVVGRAAMKTREAVQEQLLAGHSMSQVMNRGLRLSMSEIKAVTFDPEFSSLKITPKSGQPVTIDTGNEKNGKQILSAIVRQLGDPWQIEARFKQPLRRLFISAAAVIWGTILGVLMMSFAGDSRALTAIGLGFLFGGILTAVILAGTAMFKRPTVYRLLPRPQLGVGSD